MSPVVEAAPSGSPNGVRCVVELIGPPGAGKTTLALATAAEFTRRGISARLSISARPGESPGESVNTATEGRRPSGGAAALARAAKLVGALRGMTGAARKEPVSDALLRLMPLPFGPTALRRRRYLAGLSAGTKDGLSLRDQGYVCAIAGLALDSGRADERALAAALDLAPLPDIVIRVGVPRDIAETRLRERLAQQGRAERMFERPPEANLPLIAVFDMIETLLARRGRPVLHVSGRDRAGLESAVAAIVAAVLARQKTLPGGAVSP